MISRVTDDYHRVALSGCADGFRDDFRHLTEVEPRRAGLAADPRLAKLR